MEYPFKREDFTDGITGEEKYDLARDLVAMSTGIQAHDQSILQVIGSLNTIKKILVDKEVTTEDEYTTILRAELDNISKIFADQLAEQVSAAEKSAEQEAAEASTEDGDNNRA